MDFLPTDYEVPVSSNYMKLEDGANTFRVLSSAITGWEFWNTENKPVRVREALEELPQDIRYRDGQPERIKPFWAFLVYNYKAKKVQILELTQKSLMTAILALVKNEKWGDPKGYDITVTRSGNGLDTEYNVVPEPHSPSPVQNVPAIDLTVLYEGGDPFAPKEA